MLLLNSVQYNVLDLQLVDASCRQPSRRYRKNYRKQNTYKNVYRVYLQRRIDAVIFKRCKASCYQRKSELAKNCAEQRTDDRVQSCLHKQYVLHLLSCCALAHKGTDYREPFCDYQLERAADDYNAYYAHQREHSVKTHCNGLCSYCCIVNKDRCLDAPVVIVEILDCVLYNSIAVCKLCGHVVVLAVCAKQLVHIIVRNYCGKILFLVRIEQTVV